jgi:hypothetical protein
LTEASLALQNPSFRSFIPTISSFATASTGKARNIFVQMCIMDEVPNSALVGLAMVAQSLGGAAINCRKSLAGRPMCLLRRWKASPAHRKVFSHAPFFVFEINLSNFAPINHVKSDKYNP